MVMLLEGWVKGDSTSAMGALSREGVGSSVLAEVKSIWVIEFVRGKHLRDLQRQ